MAQPDGLKVVLASFGHIFAGGEVSGFRLAKGLVQRGHEVCYLIGAENSELEGRLGDAGVRWRRTRMAFTDVWTWPLYYLRRRRIEHVLRLEKPDLVHSNDLPTHQMVGDAARRSGRPRICHHRFLHDGRSADWLNKPGADRHLFNSDFLRRTMLADSRTLAAAPTAVVHNGVELPVRPSLEDRRRLRTELGLPAEAPLAAYVGQMTHVKGVDDLLHAWALLPEGVREASELVLVGEDVQSAGEYRRRMKALAAELGVRARFVGFQRDVAPWVVAADVAVVPSRLEPFGLVAIEAMANVRPVIASRVGGLPEIVVDGETGLLVPPDDPRALAQALAALLAEPARAAAMGEAGRQRCERQFSVDVYVEAVLRQYRILLEQIAAPADGPSAD